MWGAKCEKSFNSPENVLLSLQTGFLALSLMSASAPLSDLDLPPGHLMEGRSFPAVILDVSLSSLLSNSPL